MSEAAKTDLRQGDCLEVMRSMDAASVTAIVTDPPYALEFMGKGWDKVLPSADVWKEALRVLKPGGVLLCFGGTRTFHRLTCSIEDAGFQIRDCLMWMYGSGFPKSLDISKAIDKADGAERPVVGEHPNPAGNKPGGNSLNMSAVGMPDRAEITTPATERSAPWAGYGTALKPSWEPVILAMKPTDGTYAANALAHGVAGINVDECRIEGPPSGLKPYTRQVEQRESQAANHKQVTFQDHSAGRWHANVVHDGSDEVLEQFPEGRSSGVYNARDHKGGSSENTEGVTSMPASGTPGSMYDDKGSASRFFYCAKASKKDRGPDNKHPTVKPTELMRWLVRMVTMPAGTVVLDPFMGSGSTGVACAVENVDFIGIELSLDYLCIAQERIYWAGVDANNEEK